LPHAPHTKGSAIPALGLALSPLAVVGPILEADILPTPYPGAVSNLSVTKAISYKEESLYGQIDIKLVRSVIYVPMKWDNIYIFSSCLLKFSSFPIYT
jgi:hypothetical protein